MSKQKSGNSVVQFLIGRAIGLYMLLVGVTTRWQRINQAAGERFWTNDGQLVACVWHGRFGLTHKLWRFRPGDTKVAFLVSRSREGEIAANTAMMVGAEVVRGSAAKGAQQKGGAEAALELVRYIKSGGTVGLTPDGPRGPRMRAGMGPVLIARLAQAPLMGLAWSTNWRVVSKSWDRMIMPLPFGRGVLIWSDPIAPPSRGADDAEMERVRAALEAELIRISAEADRLAGVDVIEPAPARAAAMAESAV